MKIALIRHGMTEGNYKKRYIGKTDEPLADTKSLDLDYPDCSAVIASPMKRCIMTAQFIYPKKEIIICPELCECDFGDFENKSYDDLKDNPYYIKWLESGGKIPFPGGEAHNDFTERCVDGFHKMADNRYESISFVIHGGSIMAIMQHLYGGGFYDYQLRCGGMFRFDYDARAKRAVNDFVREE